MSLFFSLTHESHGLHPASVHSGSSSKLRRCSPPTARHDFDNARHDVRSSFDWTKLRELGNYTGVVDDAHASKCGGTNNDFGPIQESSGKFFGLITPPVSQIFKNFFFFFFLVLSAKLFLS